MSNETVLPPSIPEDASKSTIPSTPNIRQTGPAKMLQTSITGVVIEKISVVDTGYQFANFAIGVIARCCKASINLTGTEVPGVYSKYIYPLASTWDDCQTILAKYFYNIYVGLLEGHTSLPYHPRNIGFLLMAMARNRVVSIQGQVKLHILSDLTFTPLSEDASELVATLLRHQALNYDLVNVPVFESGPFPTSKDDQAKSSVEHCKITLDQIGSTYTTYTRNSIPGSSVPVGTVYSDYYAEDIDVSTWWIKAALAYRNALPITDANVTATWSNISPPAEMLTAWVAYSDTVCDVPYVFFSQNYFPTMQKEPTTVNPNPVSPYYQILSTWLTMYKDNGEDLSAGDLFDDLNDTSHMMYKVWNYAACLYSPFGTISMDKFIDAQVPLQSGSSPFERLLHVCSWRVPIYLPSLYSECISSVAEQTIIKSTQDGFTHSTQIFNVTRWPIYFNDTNRYYVSIQQMTIALELWQKILIYRKFIKLNLNPEYKVNKAVLPYFFLHVSLNKPYNVGPSPSVQPFDAIITPYSTRFIEDHNLHVLARAMPWPQVNEISQSLLAWLPIIDVRPLNDGSGWSSLLPAFEVYQFAMLCVDMSYMADGCEIDSYLNKLRTSHLGFFAALAGLLPTALKIGTALFKTIAKPKDIDKATSDTNDRPSVDREQTNNMAMAGISSLSQTTSGEPGTGGTIDLSSSVNVDPAAQVLEAGKKFIRSRKLVQAVNFGGKALKFGRTFYKHYKRE